MESSKVRWVCLATIVVAFLAGDLVAAAVKPYNWTVSYMDATPDCVTKTIIAINKQFPGPPIRAAVGDTILVYLTNAMSTEGVTIHWHGIRQKGTPWADGTAGFSQCAINPGETFLYNFTVDHAGTFFYHGHYGCQRAAGLYGSLIVSLPNGEKEPYTYDNETSILISDWWHASIYEQENGLHSSQFKWVGAPQSLLIEGRGNFDCAMTAGSGLPCKQTAPECAPHVIQVEFNKTYRLRIATVASLAPLNIKLEDHNMTVVEADAYNVEEFKTDNLDLYSGESYSVLFTADQDPTRNYWLALNERGRPHDKVPTAVALLQYVTPANNMSIGLPTTPYPMGPAADDFKASEAQAQRYKARAGYNVPVPAPTRMLNLLNLQSMHEGRTRWSINNVSYELPQTPVLASMVWNISDPSSNMTTPPDNYTGSPNISIIPNVTECGVGSGAYVFELGEVVDIIIQNANTLVFNTSEIHPWHLHGHDFWVLGYGEGLFNDTQNVSRFNTINPPMKNTVAIYPYGWTAIRFVADNPGVWPFHCHVEWHFELGMGVAFAVGIANVSKTDFPMETLGCGLSKPNFRP